MDGVGDGLRDGHAALASSVTGFISAWNHPVDGRQAFIRHRAVRGEQGG